MTSRRDRKMKLVTADAAAFDDGELKNWDPAFVEQIKRKAWPILQRYFRAEVHGLEAMPPNRGALLVGNHSGGSLTPDVVIFGSTFYDRFGYARPLFTLAHSQVFFGHSRNGWGASVSSTPPGTTRQKRYSPVRWFWCFQAGIMTHTGRLEARTSSTSTAERATSAPPLRPVFRSCRLYRLAARKRNCS